MMNALKDTLYFTWVIGTKDILDALKNKISSINILLMLGMVVFFYWLGTWRPFDKGASVVVVDPGSLNLLPEKITLNDDAMYVFRQASSLQELETKMAHQNLGVVLPTNLDEMLASGATPTLNGYIFWVDRQKVTQLEAKYSQDFSEILGKPVQIVIGQNIIIPQANSFGMHATTAEQMIYYVFMTALVLIPHLMLEEKQTRTMDALLTSPASPGQVVAGKALAGFFYVLVIGGLALTLFSQYIVHWGWALVAFLGYALFAVGLGLAMGSYIKSMMRVGLWTLVLVIFLVVPPIFYMEPNLKAGIRTVLTWMPSSALATLFRYACSTGATFAQILPNLAIAGVSIAIVFGLVVWKVQRADR